MTTIPFNRRNFLSSLAILSVGTTFGSTLKYLPLINEAEDLQQKWMLFWKKTGGREFTITGGLKHCNYNFDTKGHLYKYGEIIYFPKENIIAQPMWIFWQNNSIKPVDVLITLFENNNSYKKIIRLNRYEMEALYHISNEPASEKILLASFNNNRPIADGANGIITAKTNIKKKSQIQDISYYKGQSLLYKNKIIYHN